MTTAGLSCRWDVARWRGPAGTGKQSQPFRTASPDSGRYV
jgi:hypothetical protein